MNCQPGDLALVISGHERSIGATVICLRMLAPGESITVGPFDVPMPPDVVYWLIEPAVQWRLRFTDSTGFTSTVYIAAPYCADRCLMPIRPERDEDLEAVQKQSDDLNLKRWVRIPESTAHET